MNMFFCNLSKEIFFFLQEAKGSEFISCLSSCLVSLGSVESLYLSLSCVGAVIKYCEHVQQQTFANGSLKIQWRAVEGWMQLDAGTVRELELVRNARTGDTKMSMLGMMNFTRTAGGGRLLRTSLLQPLADRVTIEMRLSAVDEFLRSEKTYFEVGTLLAEFLDLDHLAALQFAHNTNVTSLHGSEQSITNIIYLKQSLDAASKVAVVLESSNNNQGPANALMKAILANLQRGEIQQIRTLIGNSIEPDACKRAGAIAMRTERYFAVKAGQNGLLDVARKTYVEMLDDVQDLLARYSREFLMDGLRLKNNSKRGYFFSLAASSKVNPSDFDVFTHVQRQGQGAWTFTSEELESYNERLRESGAEISLLTAKVVEELIANVRQHLGVIHSVSDSISMLDMIYSFASWVCLSDQMVRPEIVDNGPIAIKQGVHPIVLGTQPDMHYVPNDTYLSTGNNFCLITGQNMAGKSTYVKQVALLTILAHIGSYVPAAWATFRVTDRVFTRIGTDDDMEHNSSSFLVEMREVADIIQNTTRRSLVIIDELGRATSTTDGVGLAWSISEFLLSCPCYTVFTTHFKELLQLSELYPNVKCFSMTSDTNMQSTFVLAEGQFSASGYGIRAAASAGLGAAVIERAEEIKSALHEFHSIASGNNRSEFTFYHVAERVLALKNSSLDKDTLHDYLMDLKRQIIK